VPTKKTTPTSKSADDIFEDDEFARSWIRAMAQHGDPIRMSLVNPIVAFAADYFVANPLRPSNRSPRNLIQEALQRTSSTLKNAAPATDDPTLHRWHTDIKHLAETYPNLKNAVIWDLGCGEGYLARWLASQGATCVGAEPSTKLFKHAHAKVGKETTIFQATIDVFLKQHAPQCLSRKRPTLISLIAVLDGCGNANHSLDEINSFMCKHQLSDVPLLVTTFDPDFFCVGLPKSPINNGSIRIFDTNHKFTMRDPAEWELTFAEHNFHVIDQRPIHLDMLPLQFMRYVLNLCRSQIAFDADAVDLISPRQGPFYFWIIAPRPRKPARSIGAIPALRSALPNELISFDKGEVIEVRGNLGSKVYEILAGSAHFDYAGLFDMTFSEGMFFGQMEVNQNYFASRMLGHITALQPIAAQSFQLSEVAALAKSDSFAGKLLMSMVGHLDSVSYTRLLNSKHIRDENRSAVLPKAVETSVRNCAAMLLNACARNCSPRMVGYKARLLIELTYDELQKAIYHDVLPRRDMTGVIKALTLLVQNSVIDCFSTNGLAGFRGDDGQDDIDDITDEKLAHEQFLHLGLIAAHYLRKVIDKHGANIDLKTIAIAISAFLGSERDQHNIKNMNTQFADIEDRNREQLAERGKKAVQARVKKTASGRTIPARLAFLMEKIDAEFGGLTDEIRDKVSRFMNELQNTFNFREDKPYAKKGFSKFIIVRDVWALLACAMNDKNIWMSNRDGVAMGKFVGTQQQRHRLIAYFYECVAHIGLKYDLAI
jgi:hypothetical protein